MDDGDPADRTNHDHYYDQPTRWARFVANIKRAYDERRTKNKQEDPANKAARRTATATWAIAIFTLVTIGVGISQFFEMRGQLTAMQGQLTEMQSSGLDTKKLANATQTLADKAALSAAQAQRLADAAAGSAADSHQLASDADKATQAAIRANALTQQLAREASRANGINQQALIGVQRAFMFPKGVDFEKVTATGRAGFVTGWRPIGWSASVKWGNSGNTPTKDLVITTNCVVSMKGPLDEPYLITGPDIKNGIGFGSTKAGAVFGPKQELDAGACFFNPISITINAYAGLNYYVFGDATYKDVLDASITHVTEFCFILQITGNPETGYLDLPGIQPLQNTTRYCIKHNCADDECRAQQSQ